MKKTSIAALLIFTAVMGSCTSQQAANTVEAHTAPEVTTAGETTGAEPLEKYVITCAELASKVFDSGTAEFPPHMEVTDEVMISDVMGYDKSLVTDSSINVQLVSADLFELTLFRVSGENGEAVLNMLNERKDYLQKQAAFYPAQVEAAEATVVSHTDDIYYLICHKDAAKIQKALVTAVKTN